MPVITPHIPEGLIELMKILAKSVLKEKPENIHEFAAEHFENLLIEQNGSLDKGYEKSKSCEKCLTKKEKVFFEYVLSNQPKLINESNEDASTTLGQQCGDKKFHPRKLSSKKPSEILLSIKEEDEGTQNPSEKEKIAANIIQNAFKSYMERRLLLENGHPAIESDGMTKEAAAIIIQKALKKYLGDKNVIKDNGTEATKTETPSENNNDENIDKQVISENVENCTVVDVLEEDKRSQNKNVEGVENVLGENKNVSIVDNNDENNEIDPISNTKTHKNSDEHDQQTEDISRQDTLPMDETAEIYKDEIGTQEIGHTNDLAHRNNDKNVIAIERNESVNNANNSQHFATLPEVAQNENESTNKKALWYVGEEPIITSTEETMPSSHVEKDLTNLINAKNIINTPESALSKTLRESKAAANDSIDAPIIYDSLAFNNNQFGNISEIKNFVSTEIKSIGGEVKGDSIGAELTSDANPESEDAVGGSSETNQGHASGSLDAQSEGKLLVTDGKDSEDNNNKIIEDAHQMEEKETHISPGSQPEKEIVKSSESLETKAELGSAMIKIDSTEIKDDIEKTNDDSKHSSNYTERDESATKDENVNEVAENKSINQLDTISENSQMTAILPVEKSEKSGKEDQNVTDDVNLKIVESNEIEKKADSPTGIEEPAIENIDEPTNKADEVIVSMEKEISKTALLDHLSNTEMEQAPVTQSNNEIATASSSQNEAKIETNLDDLNTSNNSSRDGKSSTPDAHKPEIEEAGSNMDKLKENINLNLDIHSNIDTNPSSKENSIEENIVKRVVDPAGRQVSGSSDDAKTSVKAIANYNNDNMDNEVVDRATESKDKSTQEEGEANNAKALGTQFESESHLQSKLLTEEKIAQDQVDVSVKQSTKDASEKIPKGNENKGHEETAKETGQLLQESEVNKQVGDKLEKLKSTEKLNQSAESDEKGQLDENLTKDNIENQITSTEKVASIEENIENFAQVEEQKEINEQSEEKQNTDNSVESSFEDVEKYQTNAEEKIPPIEENPESFTQVQQREINEESEQKQNANDNVEPPSEKQVTSVNVDSSNSVKGASAENIKENQVANQTNPEEKIQTVIKSAENPENLTNVQEQREIDEKCEERRNINDNIEPTSDKQDTNDNVESSNPVESAETIKENNVQNQTNPEEENAQNLANVQEPKEKNENNDKIGLAEPDAENNGGDSEDKENIVFGDKENDNPEKLEEVNINKKPGEADDVPGVIENTQSIKEDNKTNILENIVQNTNNNVDEAIDKENLASESSSEITEAKDINIEEEEPSVITADGFDQEENIANKSSVEEKSSENIAISNNSETGKAGDCENEDVKEVAAEGEIQKIQSANLMAHPIPEEDGELKKDVGNKSRTDFNSSNDSAELNLESKLHSPTPKNKDDWGDEEEVEVAKPRDYVNKNLASTNKSSAGENTETPSASSETALKESDSIDDKEQSAIQIQKIFRGYMTRKDLKNKPMGTVSVEPEIISTKNDGNPEVNEAQKIIDAIEGKQNTLIDGAEENAALTIQKTFRGHRTRRDLSAQIESHKQIEENVANISDSKQNSLSDDIDKQPDEDKPTLEIQNNGEGLKSTQSPSNGDAISNNETPDEAKQADTTKQNTDEPTLSEEDAAMTIQKNYRGYKTRKQFQTTHSKEDSSKENGRDQETVTENSTDKDAVAPVIIPKTDDDANQPETMEQNPDESNLREEDAAMTIQKNYRGYKTRKQLKTTNSKEDSSKENGIDQGTGTENSTDEEAVALITIPKTDNETTDDANQAETTNQNTEEPSLSEEDAAMTIQKNYRGYKTRKQLKTANSKENSSKENGSNQETECKNSTDEEAAAPETIPKTDNETTDDANQAETTKHNTEDPALNEENAAMTIQKNYRGYKTRKQLKTTNSKENSSKENGSNQETVTDNSTDEEAAAPVTIPKMDIETTDDANQAETTNQNTEEPSLSEEDAAMTIQKNYRGYKTRKQLKTTTSKEDSSKENGSNQETECKNSTDEEAAAPETIPKTDNETTDDANQAETTKHNTEDPALNEENAAMTIQKNYRGYKTRKQLKTTNSKENSSKENGSNQETVTDNSTDEEAAAPVTIPKMDNETTDDANQAETTNQNTEEPSWSEEDAAMTIQKNYRGYKTRKQLIITNSKKNSSKENGSNHETVTENSTDEEAVPPITIPKMDNETTDDVNKAETTKHNTDEPNLSEEDAAMTIQKNYRGYKTRKQLKTTTSKEDSSKENGSNQKTVTENSTDEEAVAPIKIPKTDNETTDDVNKAETTKHNTDEPNLSEEDAAMTIQKNYRGYKTRKQLKTTTSKEDSSKENGSNQETVTENSTDEEAVAPITIPKTDNETTDDVNKAETTKHNTDEPNLSEEDAAMTIQKNYRGYKTRKQLKTANSKENSSKENGSNQETECKNSTDEEAAAPETIPKTDNETTDDANQAETTKHNTEDPALNEENAAMTIQKNYRGYKTRKQLKTTNSKENSSKENGSNQETVTDNSTDEEAAAPVTIPKTDNETTDDVNKAETTKHNTDEPNLSEEDAAMTIQKNYRGYKTRKQLKTTTSKEDSSKENGSNQETVIENSTDEEAVAPIKIPKTDNETTDDVNKAETTKHNTDEPNLSEEDAAMTIQKNYRGYKTRKQLKTTTSKEDSSKENGSNQETVTENSTDEEAVAPITIPKTDNETTDDVNKAETTKHNTDEPNLSEEDAAMTIQKNYRGYKTRKQLKITTSKEDCSKENGSNQETITENSKDEEAIAPVIIPKTDKEPTGEGNQAETTKPDEPTLKKESGSNSDREGCQDANNKTQIELQPEPEQQNITQPADSTEIERGSDAENSQSQNQKTDEEAALTIQKNYRGYRTRRDVSRKQEIDENRKDVDKSTLDEEKAAIAIQKNFRDYKTRQDLKIGKFPLIKSNSDEGKQETEVDENESIEQAEEDQERLIAKRFSAVSDTGLSDAETVRAESRSTINDEISDIENVDLSSYADDSLEGMYYSLRKNEIIFDRMQRRASERKSSLVERQLSGHFDNAMYVPVQPMSELQKANSAETDEETVTNDSKFDENPIIAASKKNQNFLENMHRSNSQPTQIIESDNEGDALQQESYEDYIESRESTPIRDYPKAKSFESPLEATKKESENFLDKLHGTIQNVNQSTIDEDTTAAIRRKMLACSISEADSDYCEVAEERTNAIHDDFNISTALETVTSTDTDSTIISAATKIQAGARGFLTRRRLRRASVGAISTQSEKNASFGNEAIDESLENLIEENAAIKTQHSYRGYMQHKSHTTPSPSPTEETFSSKSKDSNDKVMGITDIKLEHKFNDSQDAEIVKNVSEVEKSHSGSLTENERTDDITRSTSTEDESPIVVNLDELNLAARRLTLQRGDAVQKDSTPEDDAENAAQSEEHVEDETENSNIPTAADKGKRRRTELMKLFGTRQRTMPVQIDSEILRVIPKHLRKRIKSAEAQKKKRNNLQ